MASPSKEFPSKLDRPAATILHCPSCGRTELDPFYRVDGIPVSSCLLSPSARLARDYPKGDLELAVCLHCGFIFNNRFDPADVPYAPEYEDQQCYSPTFTAFSEQLAARLISEFDLAGKHIVEIGCGKGDFLERLCRDGRNQGVGVDPSIHPRQVGRNSGDAIRWLAEPFGPQHAKLPVDFVCCRHTLEHVQDVGAFVRQIREMTGDRPVPVFIEVPDTRRLLLEGSFEDIYYEHCSYFTASSLTNLMHGAGFEVGRIDRDYANQYLLMNAVPSGQRPAPERNRGAIRVRIDAFRHRVAEKQERWSTFFKDHADERVALWGSGSKCVSLLSTLRPDLEPLTVVDINPHRHGKYLPGSGLRIESPEVLKTTRPRWIVAMNSIYLPEIQRSLDEWRVGATLLGL